MMGDTINYYDLEFSLQSAFRAFDVKNVGSIDAEDLRRALEYTDVDPDEARQFIDDLDIDNDGSITYEEFTKHVSDSIVREALGVKNDHSVTHL